MLIESIIKRDPSTVITMDKETYTFKPDEKGRHVAEVTDKHHIARLLSISEGYQLADGDEAKLPKALKKEIDEQTEQRQNPPQSLGPVDENVLKGSPDHPATFNIKGEQISIEDVIFQAHEASGMTTAEWNAMPDDARAELIDAVLDAMADEDADPANPPTPPAPDADTGSTNANADADETGDNDKPDNDKPDDGKGNAEASDSADPGRDKAAQDWKEKHGKLPHWKWTEEKIREELAKEDK